jgi:hypothetical protein
MCVFTEIFHFLNFGGVFHPTYAKRFKDTPCNPKVNEDILHHLKQQYTTYYKRSDKYTNPFPAVNVKLVRIIHVVDYYRHLLRLVVE